MFLNREIHGYKLVERIGQGGMGEVYRAVHNQTGKVVAFKVLLHLRGIDRFRNEARLQANVDHPNIAKLYDLVEIDGRPALIIEFVKGPDLDVYLSQNPLLSIHDKLNLFAQVTSAIAHLHKLSITHRDIKPSNIKVTPEGEVKIIDFGIAKGYSSPTITTAGQTIGTLDYMSPERLKGKYIKESDVWSLGVILYEMMTGQHPFRRDNEIATRRAINKSEYRKAGKKIDLSRIDKQIAAVIDKSLQVNPSKRYPAASDLFSSVNRILHNDPRAPIPGPIPPTKWTRYAPLAAGIIGVILLLSFVISKFSDTSAPPGPVITDGVTLTFSTGIASQAYVILPNGERCPTPCIVTRQRGSELEVLYEAEGYTPKRARIQFRMDGNKPFTLRKARN